MPKHIITTDDDPAIRKILQIMLKKEGYRVTSCENASILLSVLEKNTEPVDLIFLDIKMPGITGMELLPSLRSSYPRTPVVMLTAFNDLDTGMKAIRLGAADYLAKPVHREALVSCVNRVISKAEASLLETQQSSVYLAEKQELECQLEVAVAALKDATIATLEAFSETLEQKDAYTKGHCSRVRLFAVAMAKALKLTKEQILTIEGGSLLHDIGKVGISEDILNKTCQLSDEEYELIKSHPLSGERIVSHIPIFDRYRPIIRSHHERLDGLGYPDGLKGDQIPLEVRIVTLADAFDAMTSSRAYRESIPKEIAVEELKLFSGNQFDPMLVDLFIDKELYLL